jgi:lycopene beta-cyclase
MRPERYDYIISGTGCAGLSLVMHMIHSGRFGDKQVLLVDEAAKNQNDRTWCFWEVQDSIFEPIVYREWNNLWFYGEGFSRELSIHPFRYKMIRGLDFYKYCIDKIKQQPNFHFLYGKVQHLFSEEQTGIVVNGQTIHADFVFNSILWGKPALKKKHHWLLQHFKGWRIRTTENIFDTASATLMDFRVSQEEGTTFSYVLPLSAREALVEYTLFTPTVLQDQAYDRELKNYIEQVLKIRDYEVVDTEFGVIPMTNYRFPKKTGNIINIGTAGGQTKGSSGYTFYFIQQHSNAIVQRLAAKGNPFINTPAARFHFYDSVLLTILQRNTLPGKEIFSTLFQKNKPQDVLTFLNNESSLLQELKIISALPTLPFLRAAMRQVF